MLGGAAERSMDGDATTQAYDPKAMAIDATGGAAGVVGAKVGGALVEKATGPAGNASMAEAARQGGKALGKNLVKKGAEKAGEAAGEAAGREGAEKVVGGDKPKEKKRP